MTRNINSIIGKKLKFHILAVDLPVNWWGIQKSEFCGVLSDSVLMRYHQKVNNRMGNDERRNFYDDTADIHPDSSELIGDYVCRAIDLVGYVVGPAFRLSVKLGNESRDKDIIKRGLPRYLYKASHDVILYYTKMKTKLNKTKI